MSTAQAHLEREQIAAASRRRHQRGMEKKYYPDLVEWIDVLKFVKDKPFEDDFTISMYDSPEGAEIPGDHFRVRILPSETWPHEEYAGGRSYLVQSQTEFPNDFIVYQNSPGTVVSYAREEMDEDVFDNMIDISGSKKTDFT